MNVVKFCVVAEMQKSSVDVEMRIPEAQATVRKVMDNP